ncbi:MBL fold metallo-hydrolase [Tardiphaga sp. vice352]|uniref:MBL fold metallo-hydrolase n=1 Tax=unclassified Tardiphaga TaxID=2631404 RepID=UPI0011644CAF|nr:MULTISPECIES: MBL fold metallo-hydrolase [unclassified Tardiphaga]QDM15354.1 MBL fold metallo-hydrolase [Tardiphaga sp. vice278]QDM25523.1 MBL fold metallo-hydrolase [Tardiphaga sp. vice304]QDM30732.1 MBL fold metallo-hydrolase [Tardiphaga sp. vice352]
MQWQVGRVKVTRIMELESVGGTRFILPQVESDDVTRHPWMIPHFADVGGGLKMAVHSLVLEAPGARIIVDTGLGNHKQGRSVPVWNDLDTPYLDNLTAAGFAPDTIDMVLCTHLHVDHVGWNTRLVDGRWVPTFPNAKYIFGDVEYKYWKAHSDSPHQAAVFADSVQPIVDAGLADLVASDLQLSDEITLLPTPGHSPGHFSVLIQSDGQQALLLGDVAHTPLQMQHLDWSTRFDTDAAQYAATRHDLFSRFADTETLVIGGHFSAGHIRRDGDAFRFTALQD